VNISRNQGVDRGFAFDAFDVECDQDFIADDEAAASSALPETIAKSFRSFWRRQ
jgi:hypothetical protein